MKKNYEQEIKIKNIQVSFVLDDKIILDLKNISEY